MKAFDAIKSVVSAVSGIVGAASTAVGNTATGAVTGTIQATGGRRFFYGGIIAPVFALVAHFAHMDPVLAITALSGILATVGVEGVRDIRATMYKDE